MRRIFLLAFLFFFAFYSFSQEFSEYDDGMSDFDSLFDDAGDTVVEEGDLSKNSDENAGAVSVVNVGSSVIPLYFYGSVTGKTGGAIMFSYNDQDDIYGIGAGGYIYLKNILGFLARVDNTFSIRGSWEIEAPTTDWKFKLSELYFDYLFLDRIYFTLGKKGFGWGYTRIFSDDELYGEGDRLLTNIMADSGSNTTVSMRIPFDNWNFTAVGLVGSTTSPGKNDVGLAASLEGIVCNTAVNFFARKFASSRAFFDGVVGGVEAKRTILGTDIYAQGMLKGNETGNKLSKFLSTGGFYHLWDSSVPHVWVNAEAQFSYSFLSYDYTLRTASEVGVKRLSKARNLKIGLNWDNSWLYLEDKKIHYNKGNFRVGVTKSGFAQNLDWTTGVECYYNSESPSFFTNVKFGTYIEINMNY